MIPNRLAASTRRTKVECAIARAAKASATAAESDASEKPRLRPMRCISIVAGIVVTAVAMITIETGKVANLASGDRDVPSTPASVTIVIEPVAEMVWQKNKMIKLLLFTVFTALSRRFIMADNA